jgi:hypothetical protein
VRVHLDARLLKHRSVLLCDDDEPGPSDHLRLQFEAASRLDPRRRNVVKALIEGMLLKHKAKTLGPIA